jgi:hypothetical protein
MSDTRNTPVNDPAPKKTKRTPQQLAEFHRAIARKNDCKYALAANPTAKLSAEIMRDIVKLATEVHHDEALFAKVSDAGRAIELVTSKLIEATLAERDGAR